MFNCLEVNYITKTLDDGDNNNNTHLVNKEKNTSDNDYDKHKENEDSWAAAFCSNEITLCQTAKV